jgi:hypothetical protein
MNRFQSTAFIIFLSVFGVGIAANNNTTTELDAALESFQSGHPGCSSKWRPVFRALADLKVDEPEVHFGSDAELFGALYLAEAAPFLSRDRFLELRRLVVDKDNKIRKEILPHYKKVLFGKGPPCEIAPVFGTMMALVTQGESAAKDVRLRIQQQTLRFVRSLPTSMIDMGLALLLFKVAVDRKLILLKDSTWVAEFSDRYKTEMKGFAAKWKSLGISDESKKPLTNNQKQTVLNMYFVEEFELVERYLQEFEKKLELKTF